MNYTIILALMGGLGLFLYGMKLMSDGLEKAAGAKLRRILEIFTTNRLTGMLVGIFFTAVIQSSSAATVMVVSFVKDRGNLRKVKRNKLGSNSSTNVSTKDNSSSLRQVHKPCIYKADYHNSCCIGRLDHSGKDNTHDQRGKPRLCQCLQDAAHLVAGYLLKTITHQFHSVKEHAESGNDIQYRCKICLYLL